MTPPARSCDSTTPLIITKAKAHDKAARARARNCHPRQPPRMYGITQQVHDFMIFSYFGFLLFNFFTFTVVFFLSTTHITHIYVTFMTV